MYHTMTVNELRQKVDAGDDGTQIDLDSMEDANDD